MLKWHKDMRYLSILVLCLVTFCGFIPVVFAQSFAQVDLVVYPKFPKIGDKVTVTAESSDVNLEFQQISWYINGEKVTSGTGQASTVFLVKPDPKTYTVQAIIGDIANQLTRQVVISPGDVILLWEAVDSYVPPWYLGKALMPAEGLVRITAIPVGADTLDRLFFVWEQGGQSLGSLSGYAKNSIIVGNSILIEDMNISVTVSSANGNYQSQGEVTIPRSEPDVRIWSPNIGGSSQYEQGNTLKLYGADAVVQLLPYGVSSRAGFRGLSIEWLLNQIPYNHNTNESQSSIFISRSSTPITADVVIQSVNHLLQEISVTKKLLFE